MAWGPTTVIRTATAAGATHLVLEPAEFTRGDLTIVDGQEVITEIPV